MAMLTKEKSLAYLSVLRIDHWVKNLFICTGILFALAFTKTPLSLTLGLHVILLLFVFGLVASVNYVINEIVDAPFDRFHPTKKFRAIPSGKVRIRVLLGIIAVLLSCALIIAHLFLPSLIIVVLIGFFVSGIIYNIPPIRLKDVFILDVITESVNNPIRFLAGWLLISPMFPPIYFLWAFWALGAFWMAGKRYGEIVYFVEAQGALKQYRASFKNYTQKNLLTFIILSTVIFFVGFLFIVRSYPSLWVTIPFVLLYFVWYFAMIMKKNSLVREPETIVQKPWFMLYHVFLGVLFFAALFLW